MAHCRVFLIKLFSGNKVTVFVTVMDDGDTVALAKYMSNFEHDKQNTKSASFGRMFSPSWGFGTSD